MADTSCVAVKHNYFKGPVWSSVEVEASNYCYFSNNYKQPGTLKFFHTTPGSPGNYPSFSIDICGSSCQLMCPINRAERALSFRVC
jgi:hypothetical protein